MPGPKMIESALQHGQRVFHESQKAGRRGGPQVLRPGDPMYHGRVGKLPEEDQQKVRRAWADAHGAAQARQRNHDWDEEFYRDGAHTFGLLTAGTAGVSLGVGELSRRSLKRQNEKLSRQRVRKWDVNEPFMITSDGKSPHKVSTLSAEPHLKLKLSRRARFGRHLLSENGALTATAILSGAALAGVPLAYRESKRHEELKRRVGKALTPSERVRLAAVRNLRLKRESGSLAATRSRAARDDFALRSRLKRESFQRRTWDKKTPQGDLRLSRGGPLNLPKERSLTSEDRNMLYGRPYGQGIHKALKDPKKAYEGHVRGAQAKGQTPMSFEDFVARAEGTGAKQAHREAESAAQKEARQHRVIPETHPWQGKPLRESFRSHIHPGSVRNAAVSTGIAGSALAALSYSNRKRTTAKRDNRRDVNTALGATAGAATMDAANTIGGQGAKAALKERRNRRGVTPHEQKVWAEHKQRSLGLKPGQPIPGDDSISQSAKAKAFLHYPKDLPDWRAHRLLALKNTKGWTAGSLAGAAVTGGFVARRRTKSTTAKSLESELPRAARRAAKRNLPRLSPEEIAERRKAAEARGTAGQKSSHTPKAEKPVQSAVRPRSSFLGAGQVRDLAVGVPLGAGALYYGTRKPRHSQVAKGSKRNWAATSGTLAGGAIVAHGAEGEALTRAEREMHRVNAHNNADVPGRHTERKLRRLGINEENAAARSADRAKHIARGISHVENVRYLRSAKGLAGLGAVGAGYKAVTSKADNRRTAERTAAGAVGGAALLDAADTVTGASLKRIGTVQRDRARAKMTPEQRTAMNRDINEHGRGHGFLDERGRGRAPKPSDPHAAKNRFYRTYPKHLPGARVARLNALRDKKTGLVITTGALLGGGVAAHRQVKKGLSFSQVGLLTGSGTAGTLIGSSGTRRQNESHEAVGALAGGWAGQGLYQSAGYGTRKLVRGVKDSRVPLHEQNVPKSKMRSPEEKKAYDRFRRERRKLAREYPAKVDQKRNTPRSWHGARTERILAHTHGGRLGTALGTGATALGIGAGVKAAQRHDRNRGIGKSATYGYQTKERSWPKTAEMVGGLGLLGYGVPRIKALGPASDKGVKFAEKHGAGKEARAVQELARALGQRSNEITGRGESRLRQIKEVDRVLAKVPRSMRGEIAAAAGVLLSGHAHPTTKNSFIPIGGQ